MSQVDVAMKGVVGPAKYSDGAEARLRQDQFGGLAVSDLNPKWLELVARGFGFIYPSAAAGITFAALPATNQPTVWNPAGSGKMFVPLRVHIGYVSGTNVAGHICWATQSNAGSSLATAAPFSVFTAITPVSASLGSGNVSSMRFSTTNTATTAPVYLRPVGLNTAAMIATTVAAPFSLTFDEDGGLIVLPGTALTLTANAAIAVVAAVSIFGLELPLPPGFEQ